MYNIFVMKIEALTAIFMKMQVLWNDTSYRVVITFVLEGCSVSEPSETI